MIKSCVLFASITLAFLSAMCVILFLSALIEPEGTKNLIITLQGLFNGTP